jgi:hypothetical protein
MTMSACAANAARAARVRASGWRCASDSSRSRASGSFSAASAAKISAVPSTDPWSMTVSASIYPRLCRTNASTMSASLRTIATPTIRMAWDVRRSTPAGAPRAQHAQHGDADGDRPDHTPHSSGSEER